MFAIRNFSHIFAPRLNEEDESLRGWVAAGAPSEQRDLAAQAIRQCQRHKSAELVLSRMNLQSLPDYISRLTHVTTLWINHNRLTCLPDFLYDMNGLVRLMASHNQLMEISPRIERLSRLQTLSVDHNQLESLPMEIGHLTHLERLAASKNRLHNLPASVLDLPNLRHLGLAFNQLERLPKHFARLEDRLATLQLRYNRLLPDAPKACLDDPEHGRDFLNWYRRLDETSDYQSSTSRKALSRHLSVLFREMESDPALRVQCLNIATEANGRCEDRIAWGLNQMDMALESRRAERGQLQEADLFDSARAHYRLAALHRAAEDHVAAYQASGLQLDAIEVHLAFQTELRELMNLPLATRHMRYMNGAQLSRAQISQTAERILASERRDTEAAHEAYRAALKDAAKNPAALTLDVFRRQPLAYSIAQYQPWARHVARRHPAEHQSLQSLAHQALEAAEGLDSVRYKHACDAAMFLHNHGLAWEKAINRLRQPPPGSTTPAA